MVIAKKFIIQKHFQGEPKSTDLLLVEEELPSIKDGEFLVEAEYLSVDPYMRKYSERLILGSTMLGSQVAKIIESKNLDFPIGKRIIGYMGWRTHTIMHPQKFKDYSLLDREPYLMPDFGDLPTSVALGALGQVGLTAYFGFTELCKPKEGETVVVSGAAGAVGSIVGQIAKILGLKVIGIAGSDSKCAWLKNELGFDYAINYKQQNVTEELKKAAPEGVDCYFDNVGGEISSAVLYQTNSFARIAVCGCISTYNDDPTNMPKSTVVQPPIVTKQLSIHGFLVSRWNDRKYEGFKQLYSWIKDGKLRYQETITEGFDNMFQAFADMMSGKNFGKAIVKA